MYEGTFLELFQVVRTSIKRLKTFYEKSKILNFQKVILNVQEAIFVGPLKVGPKLISIYTCTPVWNCSNKFLP